MKIFIILCFVVLFFSACHHSTALIDNKIDATNIENSSPKSYQQDSDAPVANENQPVRSLNVNNWTYWISTPDISELAQSSYDLIVMDYSLDGDGETEFSYEQIQKLKGSGPNKKIVLAYLSIGEAESYRFYWKNEWADQKGHLTAQAPSYIVSANENWPGNYKVRYWDPRWQSIIYGKATGLDKSYLDRIIDAGFDGIYIDIIDAYEYFSPSGEKPERVTAANDMANFVIALAEYARVTRAKKDFVVVPQNGAPIIDAAVGKKYLETINGIGAEDTFFYGDKDMNNEYSEENVQYITPYLDRYRAAGKTVLAIDYLSKANKTKTFMTKCFEKGYIPLVSTRKLDRMTY